VKFISVTQDLRRNTHNVIEKMRFSGGYNSGLAVYVLRSIQHWAASISFVKDITVGC
jgi:hypothetical protein